jgi:hypothetical protein
MMLHLVSKVLKFASPQKMIAFGSFSEKLVTIAEIQSKALIFGALE